MILFVHGPKEKARKEAHKLLEVLKKKRPDSEVFRITSENLDASRLEEFLGAKGLFDDKYIVFADSLSENTSSKDILHSFLKEMKESENAFLILESALTKKEVGVFEKMAEKSVLVSEEKKGSKESPYSLFVLTDALGARNKVRLWVEYQKARESGLSPEEVHAMLFWQVKSLLAVAHSGSADEAGMKAYPYKKSLSFAKHFKEEELRNLSKDLVTLYHEARRGNCDLGTALEQWMLRL